MFAFMGPITRELLSYGGKVMVHDNREEMAFLIPDIRIIELPGSTPEEVSEKLGRPTMLLKDHPENANLVWPLDRRRFIK